MDRTIDQFKSIYLEHALPYVEALAAKIPPEVLDLVPKDLLPFLPALLLAAALVMLLSFLALVGVVGSKKSKHGPTAILVGTCGAGKTAMWKKVRARRCFRQGMQTCNHNDISQLEGGPEPVGYVTSMQENEGVFRIGARTVRLVDYPGHPRTRAHLQARLSVSAAWTPAQSIAASKRRREVQESIESASCIVFVVDSTDFPSQTQEVAELLLDVLTNKAAARRRIPVLIACNKQVCTC